MTIASEARRPTHHVWDSVTLDFPAGTMVVTMRSDGEALIGLTFGEPADMDGAGKAPGDAVIAAARTQLRSYAEGSRTVFDLPVRPVGSEFQVAVWAALLAIPYGTTSTYGAIAEAVGRPGQARAVGSAVGRNPVGIVIPCHRVIGADGSLTGFGGGLDNKVILLAREGVTAL
jgi:methylated-DNA-[protein]-cysteine S-methyltransferase